MAAKPDDEQRQGEALASLFAMALALDPVSDFELPPGACCINQQKCLDAVRAHRGNKPTPGERDRRGRRSKD